MSDNRELLSTNTAEILNPNEESFPDVLELIRNLKLYVDNLPSDIPENISAFTNDVGYITVDEVPKLPSWIGATKPTYTKDDVGLGNVENYKIASLLDAQAGTTNNTYMTPLRTSDAIKKLVPAWALAATPSIAAVNITGLHACARTGVAGGLAVENYAIPVEVGTYIDFHKIGSTADADGRLTLDNTYGTLIYSGPFSATAVYNAVWNDYAELFEKEDISEHIEPGDIVVWDTNGVTKSSKEQDNRVIGVFSNTFGHLLGGDEGEDVTAAIANGKYVPVGLAGRLPVKVTGDIKVGDLITLSSIPGVGCKCEQYIPGTIIGKALAPHTGDDIGLIKIFIQNI